MSSCKSCKKYQDSRYYTDCFICDDGDQYEPRQKRQRKPQTNADRLRAMTDEELSVFLETATESERVSETEWLKWLKGAAQI